MNQTIAPWPCFTREEAYAVSRVLLSNRVNFWTGEEVKGFEVEFANWCGVNHAIAIANGTLALDVALRALGVAEGDEVIVTSRTFIASVSAIINLGAIPVFADVEPNSGNISASTITPQITPQTRAIICVHLAGFPCDMDPIMDLAEAHGLYVLEDCAQAHGATYKGKPIGSIGHVAAWSFCQDKIMTTGGEGGMVTTNSEKLWDYMWSYKDHGKSYEAVFQRQHPPGFRWLHESFGSNYRMTEMQAAIGRIQLARMSQWTSRRQENARALRDSCLQYPDLLRIQQVPENVSHAFYKFYVYVRPDNLDEGWSRDRIIDEINKLGVPCFSGSCSEVYLEKAFENTGFIPDSRLPVARELGETSLMFLVHPSMSQSDINLSCEAIKSVMEMAS